MKMSVVLRFLVIGLIWAGACGVLIARMLAEGTAVNLMTVFPIIASGDRKSVV